MHRTGETNKGAWKDKEENCDTLVGKPDKGGQNQNADEQAK